MQQIFQHARELHWLILVGAADDDVGLALEKLLCDNALAMVQGRPVLGAALAVADEL